MIFVGIVCVFIIYTFFPQFTGQNRLDNPNVLKESKQKKNRTHIYQRYAPSDKLTVDAIERKTSLKAKLPVDEKLFYNQSIVALGDSLTEGIGDAFNDGGFVSVLDQTINEGEKIATFINYGKLGERTQGLLKRLEEPKVKQSLRKADIVIMTIGANDIIKVVKDHITNLTFERFLKERVVFEDRLAIILETIHEFNPSIHIYVVGLYNPFEKFFENIPELNQIVSDWNESSKQITKERTWTTFVPIDDIFSNQSSLFSEDHFHPNTRGYVKIAERILDYFKEEGGQHGRP